MAHPVKPVFKGHSDERTLSQSYNLTHYKEPVMKEHLSCKDILSLILRCP